MVEGEKERRRKRWRGERDDGGKEMEGEKEMKGRKRWRGERDGWREGEWEGGEMGRGEMGIGQ